MASFDNDTINNSPGANPLPATSPDQQAPLTAQDSSAQNTQAQASPATAPSGPGAQQAQSQRQQNPQLVSNMPQPDPNEAAMKRASGFYKFAEALAGGPRFSEKIDSDGNRIRTQIPLKGHQIALAIAMEALTGGMAGLQAGRGRGPGAAAMAGFQTTQRQIQQRDEQQDQQAQTDFTNKASAYAANLRTRALAQEVGMRDEAAHKDWIASHASTASYIRDKEPGAIVRDLVPESELTPEFTKEAINKGWVAIPVSYVPRFDSKGNHYSADGVPMHDNLYMIADSRRLVIPPDVITKAQEWALPGFTDRNGEPLKGLVADSSGMQLRIATILDVTNKIAALDQEQKDLDGYYGYLAGKGLKGPDGKPLQSPNLKQLVRQNPTLTNYITGPWANHFGESPSAALKTMKDGLPAKGPISNLYGGQQLLDKYDLLKDIEKKGAEGQTAANIEVGKERALIPIKAATAGAEAKARAAATATSSRNEDGSWNLSSIPVALVEANMDPSQLSKRSADYNQKLQDANAYSMQKYGRPFDIAQATTDYKQANNPQVQGMLKMVGAMSAPNGELAIAVNASKALPQLNSSMVNKVFNIAETQFGSDAATNFHTAMIGFSDLYAKVMGGGVGTDALRQSAMDVLKDGYSRGQIAGSISVLQQQIEARKSQMIGANPYLRKQFGGQEQSQNSNNVQAPPASSLKEGVATKFANGQTWTLHNGQPTQVQ